MRITLGKCAFAAGFAGMAVACSDPPQSVVVGVAEPVFVCSAGASGHRLPAPDGVWLGVNLDWSHDTPSAYAARVGRAPAVVTQFAGIPSTAAEIANLDSAVEHLAGAGGMLLLTLEPRGWAGARGLFGSRAGGEATGRLQRPGRSGHAALRPRNERILVRMEPAARRLRGGIPAGRGSGPCTCASDRNALGTELWRWLSLQQGTLRSPAGKHGRTRPGHQPQWSAGSLRRPLRPLLPR